jgi:hypothetical protein
MIIAAQNVPPATQAITSSAGMKMADVLKWAVGLGQSRDLSLAFSGTYLRRFAQHQPKK